MTHKDMAAELRDAGYSVVEPGGVRWGWADEQICHAFVAGDCDSSGAVWLVEVGDRAGRWQAWRNGVDLGWHTTIEEAQAAVECAIEQEAK